MFEYIGTPDDDCAPGWKRKIADYIDTPKQAILYTYDLGDDWEHKVVLEKILPFDANQEYPICLAGERACPPEDCGGAWGYQELLEIIKDPNHEEYKERMEWFVDDFDPEEFDPSSVEFVKDSRKYAEAMGMV